MIRIHDRFWDPIRQTIRREGIPYQWEALNDRVPDAEPSFCMNNFRVASGKIQGKHGGFVFQDSDVAKWLEGVAYSLMDQPNAELEAVADSAIDDIVAAQQPDGYLDTYYIINGLEKRWTNLMDHHELYCAGHMIEAAVAYERATGKRKLLDAVIRLVDHIDREFGPEEGKRKGYPGHPVIEMALASLYERTGDERHLKLAQYFVDQRGRQPLYFEEELARQHTHCYWLDGVLKFSYYQAHKPVREQKDAVGHAVRALYLYCGMADVARLTGDATLQDACETLWRSVVSRRMYITGAVGSSEYGEAFTFDYDLPNDTVYGETCASIALVFLARRMLEAQVRCEYADVMERALYNGVLSGMQLDGKRFFYVNPLEVLPEACAKDQHKTHVKPERQPWFSCACCPPNLIRLVMSLSRYLVSQKGRTLYMHLYAGSEVETQLEGERLAFQVETGYPWNGDVRLTLRTDTEADLALRIPGWCRAYTLHINGQPVTGQAQDGYVHLWRSWRAGDTVTLSLDMPVVVMRAHPRVYEDAGKVAVMRGPLVYCLEEKDNGPDLHLVRLKSPCDFEIRWEPELLGGVTTLRCGGLREERDGWDEHTLYAPDGQTHETQTNLCWIPYYAWANRGVGEMRVWVRKV